MSDITHKSCTKCNKVKPLEEFHKRANVSDGRHSACKECIHKYGVERALSLKQKHKKLIEKSKKRCIICNTLKSINCFYKDCRKLDGRRNDCIDCNKKRSLNWKKTHPEQKREQNRRWENANPDKVRAKTRNWFRHKRSNDVTFKLIENLRRRVSRAVKAKQKYYRTWDLFGCDVLKLKVHLQSQFSTGMSWENYGKWHIDHIKPCAAFDLSDPTEQKKCFHYSNLQPLWAVDNQRKGAKLDWE